MRLFVALFAALTALVPEWAIAQSLPTVICTGLPGCGEGPENAILTHVIPFAVSLMIQIAAGASVVFIVISGTKMLLSYGDDSKAQAARKQILLSLGGLGLALTSATIVAFVTTEEYGQSTPDAFLGGLMASVIRIILVLFNAGFMMMFALAGIRMMLAGGSQDEFKKSGAIIKWAITGAIVVNLARAIVQAFLQINL